MNRTRFDVLLIALVLLMLGVSVVMVTKMPAADQPRSYFSGPHNCTAAMPRC